MKKFLITAVFVFFSINSSAQSIVGDYHTGMNFNSFYADLVSKAAQINGDWGLFGGMRIGYNPTKNFGIGLIGHGLIPNKMGNSYVNQDGRDVLNLGYGGAEAVYRHDLTDTFFLEGSIMFGAGRVEYESLGGYDYFFIMEPGVSLNYRFVDWFAIGYSVNYQLADGVDYADLDNASLSGMTMGLNFKFGF